MLNCFSFFSVSVHFSIFYGCLIKPMETNKVCFQATTEKMLVCVTLQDLIRQLDSNLNYASTDNSRAFRVWQIEIY